MQFRMSPTGGMPSSSRRTPDDPPSSATAADRHDPGTTGEEPLLVDQLDQRLIGVVYPERVRQDVHEPVRAEHQQRNPDRRSRETAQGERQELERQGIDHRPADAGRFDVAGDLAQEMGERDGQQQQAREHDEQPALDPDAGGQPASQVHVRSSSRWNTATGP
jgi:hypothetical protein